jgi:serine/threonine protein kinase
MSSLESDIVNCLLTDAIALRRLLLDEQEEWPKQSNNFFLPLDVSTTLRMAVVKHGLQKICPKIPGARYSHYIDCISSRSIKLFCLLGFASPQPNWDAFQAFIDQGITDNDLPFDRIEHISHINSPQRRSRTDYILCKKDHMNCPLNEHLSCGILATRSWDKDAISYLALRQWAVLAPVFNREEGVIKHYEFPEYTVLPFTEDNKKVAKTGGYGEVWSVCIHSAHHNLINSNQIKGARLAVKQLFSTDEEAFHNECDFMRKLTIKGHPNTMPLLATYKLKGKYHLLFPWAPANLDEHWRSKPMPDWNHTTCLWFLKQVHGLVSALKAIHIFPHEQNEMHQSIEVDLGRLTTTTASERIKPIMDDSLNRYGRHGDLKPENVLCLEDGTLQVADFGLGKFHRLESRSRLNPDSIACSPTYSPPELAVRETVSRAYDIWSLGCIFLEFITWLTGGYHALEAFREARKERALDRFIDDLFYTVKEDKRHISGLTASTRAAVSQQIESLRVAQRHSQMTLDLLNVIEHSILVVNSKDRIDAEKLDAKMETMLRRGTSDTTYLLGNDCL